MAFSYQKNLADTIKSQYIVLSTLYVEKTKYQILKTKYRNFMKTHRLTTRIASLIVGVVFCLTSLGLPNYALAKADYLAPTLNTIGDSKVRQAWNKNEADTTLAILVETTKESVISETEEAIFKKDVDILWRKLRQTTEFNLSRFQEDIVHFRNKHKCVVIPIKDKSYIPGIRKKLRIHMDALGFDTFTLFNFEELVDNVARHANYGFLLIRIIEDETSDLYKKGIIGKKAIDVTIIDKGPGIKDIQKSAEKGVSEGESVYSSTMAGSAGFGIYMANSYVREGDFNISSVIEGKHTGTKVWLRKWVASEPTKTFLEKYDAYEYELFIEKAIEAGVSLKQLEHFMQEFMRFENALLNILKTGFNVEGIDVRSNLGVHRIVFSREIERLGLERSPGITAVIGDFFIIDLNRTTKVDLAMGLYWAFAHRYGHLLSLSKIILTYGLEGLKDIPDLDSIANLESSYIFDYNELKKKFFAGLIKGNLNNNPYFTGLDLTGIDTKDAEIREDDEDLANLYAELVACRISNLIMTKIIKPIMSDIEWHFQIDWLRKRLEIVYKSLEEKFDRHNNWKQLPLEYAVYARKMGFSELADKFEALFDKKLTADSRKEYRGHIEIMSKLWDNIDYKPSVFIQIDKYKNETDSQKRNILLKSITDLMKQSFSRLKEPTKNNEPKEIYKDLKKINEKTSITDLWDFMQGITPLAMLENVRGWRAEKGTVRKTAFVDVENSVKFIQALEDYKKGKSTFNELYEIMLSRKDPDVKTISKRAVRQVAKRFKATGDRSLFILKLAVVFHDFAKIIGLTEGSLYSGKFTKEIAGYLCSENIISKDEYNILASLVKLRPNFNTLHFGEGLPAKIFSYLKSRGVYDIDKYLNLASFLYLADVSVVNDGKLSDEVLDNTEYLAEYSNLQELDKYWGCVRLYYGFYGKDKDIIDFNNLDFKQMHNVLTELITDNDELNKFTEFLNKKAFFIGYAIFIFRDIVDVSSEDKDVLIKFLYILSKIDTNVIAFLPTYDEIAAAKFLVDKLKKFNIEEIKEFFAQDDITVDAIADKFKIPFKYDKNGKVLTIDFKKSH